MTPRELRYLLQLSYLEGHDMGVRHEVFDKDSMDVYLDHQLGALYQG